MSDSSVSDAVGAKRLYKSTIKFNNLIFPNGHVAHFKGGMFATDNPEHIAYLDEQIAANGFAGVIYIDPQARTITAEQENPMIALKKKFFKEFQEQQAAHTDPSNDMGSSNQGVLKPASTTDIAPVAKGGDAASHLRAAVSNRTPK